MPDIRACPECGQPQEWCDRLTCILPPGHWSHVGARSSAACRNLGDRNREPGGKPYTAYDYMPEARGA